MTAMQHAYSEVTSEQSTTSTSYGSTTCSIAAGSLTAGKKYLVWATAQIRGSNSSSSRPAHIRVAHGSTGFADSEYFSPQNFSLGHYRPYNWFTVWTAVSSENLVVEFKTVNADTTVYADQITLFALNISDGVAENSDWFFSEDSTDSAALTTSWVDGASITFTPSTGGQKWLVASLGQLNVSGGGSAVRSRLTRSGEGSTPQPSQSIVPYDWSNHCDQILNVVGVDLAAASNTFKEQSSSGASNSHTRLHSKVFALCLSKLGTGSGYTYTDGAGDELTASAWAVTPQTHTFTPAAGSVWIGGALIYGKTGASSRNTSRMQVGNADQPGTQTSDAYKIDRSSAAGDEGWSIQTVESLSASSITVDIDGYCQDAGGVTPKNRLIWAAVLEITGPSVDLAGAAAAASAAAGALTHGVPLAGAATGAATGTGSLSVTAAPLITSSPLKNNTGTLLAGAACEAFVHNPTTGELVIKKTGLTSHASTGVVTFVDAALATAASYRVIWRMTSGGAEGLETLTAN